MIMLQSNKSIEDLNPALTRNVSSESEGSQTSLNTRNLPPSPSNALKSCSSSQTCKESTSLALKPVIGFRWALYNCDEKWMRYISSGFQVIRWKTFCWFQLRGVLENEDLSFAEIFPCAGRQEVLRVNGLVVQEPQRLSAGDIISVMNEIRWEVCRELAVINLAYVVK